jgi:single-strand DNA-binding protein
VYHKITLVGALGADPTMRYLNDGTPVTAMSVAVSDGWGDKKSTIWFRVTAWRKLADACNEHLSKGSKVLVEGTMQHDEKGNPRTYQGQDGSTRTSFEVTASTVRFLSSKRGETTDAAPADGDDLPF